MPSASFMAATLPGAIQYTARKNACAGGGYTVCHVGWFSCGWMLASRSRPTDPLAGDRGDTARWRRRRRDGPPAPRGASLVHRDSTLSRRSDEARQARVDRLPTGDDAWLVAWPTLSRRP